MAQNQKEQENQMHSRANVVLCELEDSLATQLHSMLAALGDRVSHNPKSLPKADLVFCGADQESLQKVLDEVARVRRSVPVVVVSREASVTSWLDALEAGAADYLPAPFERTQLNWIRESQLVAAKVAPAIAIA
jgi:DNA-binding NtrC family response regulator